MQDLMAGLPGSQPTNPLSPTVNPLINPQIDRKQLAGDVADVKDAKNQKLAMMLYALGGALKGDKNFVQNTLALQEMQEGKAKEKARIETLRKTVTNPEFAAKYPWAKDMYDLAGADALSPIVSGIASSYKPTTASAERFGIVDKTTGKRAGDGSILKSEAETWKQSNQDPNLMLVPLAADATKDQKEKYYQVVGPLNERLRISTMDDYFKGMESGLYPAGSTVVNIPTGTEAPKSQVENIELFSAENKPYAERWQATSTLHSSLQGYADNLAKSDEAALTGVGATVKYVDGLIQNTKGFLKLASDDTQNFYNNAKAEDTYKTIEGQDFTKRLQYISNTYGVNESKVRDLAYLFAAARGQTGRGLSDKDYENAIQIVSGGVGKEGKIAVIQDVYNRLGGEISGAVEDRINLLNDPNQRSLYTEPQQRYFDIQTGQLKSLQSATGFKPFVNPLTQATSSQATGGPSVEERLNNPLYQ